MGNISNREAVRRERRRRETWRTNALAESFGTEASSEYSIVRRAIEQSSHASRIEMDVVEERMDTVKLAFEQQGYSVHTPREMPRHLIAHKVVPDRAPVA